MEICIYYSLTQNPWGGGNQFLRSLVKEFSRRGIKCTTTYKHQDVVLFNAFLRGQGQLLWPSQVAEIKFAGKSSKLGRIIPARFWKLGRRRGPAIVHRLDGVAEIIRGKRTLADSLHPAINRLADYTIFQSSYSKQSFKQFGVRPKESSIIHNGVDHDIFFPPSNVRILGKTIRMVAVSWSPNPRKGFSTLSRLSLLPYVEVYFIGRWCENIDPGNVRLMGVKTSSEIAAIMREMDAMVHAAENEPCSNAILEALSCGLPVLYRDSGGNRELANSYGITITENSREDIFELRAKYSSLCDRIHADRSKFSITHVATKYIGALLNALGVTNADVS